MRPELMEQTRRLIFALNLFLVHVLLYLAINFSLLVYVFGDISARWGFLFILLMWAIGLIYHGMRVYGKDPVNRRNEPNIVTALVRLVGN